MALCRVCGSAKWAFRITSGPMPLGSPMLTPIQEGSRGSRGARCSSVGSLSVGGLDEWLMAHVLLKWFCSVPSRWVIDIDKVVLQAMRLRQMLTQGPHTTALGGMVAASQVGHPTFPGQMGLRL